MIARIVKIAKSNKTACEYVVADSMDKFEAYAATKRKNGTQCMVQYDETQEPHLAPYADGFKHI